MEHWKVLLATMVGRQEKFLNSRRSRMAKTIIFWPWWQPFESFSFETLSFLPFAFVSLFSFCYAKKWEGGGHCPPAPPVSPALFDRYVQLKSSFSDENNILGRSWSFAKLFIMQTTLVRLMGCAFNNRKCMIFFIFFWRSWCAHVLLERKTNLIWSNVFF